MDAGGPQDSVYPRAARRRRAGAEPALRQHRRQRPLLAADLQDVPRQAGAQPDRFRRRGAAEHDRRWMATDKFIKDKPQVLQKTLNALYGGLAFLQDGKNRAEAIKLIAEIDEIPPPIAEAELDGNIVKLSKDGEMQKDWMVRALDMARLIGMSDLAPVEDIYTTQFRPVPTMV